MQLLIVCTSSQRPSLALKSSVKNCVSSVNKYKLSYLSFISHVHVAQRLRCNYISNCLAIRQYVYKYIYLSSYMYFVYIDMYPSLA